MNKIYHTKIKNGDLVLDKVDSEKTLSIITVNSDPILWTDTVRKDTKNLNEKYVIDFLSKNKMTANDKLAYWEKFYYVSFLLRLSYAIKNVGIQVVKETLLDAELLVGKQNMRIDRKFILTLPEVDEKTSIEDLSDYFNFLANFGNMLFIYN